MIYQEKIARPLRIPLTDDEQMKVIVEAVADEDRWLRTLSIIWLDSFEI
jgi:hypothetical protein